MPEKLKYRLLYPLNRICRCGGPKLLKRSSVCRRPLQLVAAGCGVSLISFWTEGLGLATETIIEKAPGLTATGLLAVADVIEAYVRALLVS